MATDAAAAEKAKEKMLTLRSSDHQEFELKESVAMQSVTLKNMIEGGCADNCIPLPKVTSHILAKVIEYCNKHAQPTGAGDAAGATAEGELKIFDAYFVKVEQDTLFDLILAANYLDIKGLLDLTRQTVTDMIKGKVPKEIRKTSNIENDFTVPSKPASAAAISSSERKQMDDRFNAYWAHWRKTAKERLTVFAEQGEKSRKHGYLPVQPPLEIFKYPELLERAWGWDMILPYSPAKSWSVYRNYLQEYYKRNAPSALAHQMEANAASDLNLNGDDGNGLAALFNLCINMEGQLLYLLKSRAQEFDVDEISLNDKLTNCAHQITNVDCGGFPALIVALKCIMAEADLLCKLLMCETGITSDVTICRGIRKCAFRFMTYKGPECFAAAATMMATTKEAKLMSELLRNKRSYSRSYFIRNCTLGAMFRIFKECSAVEESTGGSTAAKLIFDESDDRNCSEKELVNKDNLLESDEINQNTKICSKEELPKGNHVEERNEAKHGSGEINETEQKTKVETLSANQNTKVETKVDAKENQEDLEKSVKELLCTVEEIMPKLADLEAAPKNNKTEVICALQEVVLPRLNQVEEVIKLQKAEMVAAVQEVLQKPKEHEEMAKQDEIAKVEKNELPFKIQSRLNEMEERNLIKQNQMEGSLLSRLNQMEESSPTKHSQLEQSLKSRLNQMESSVLSRLNQMEERYLTLTQKVDSMKDLLEKLCNPTRS